MDAHDKGIALPGSSLFDEECSDTESAERGRERWSRSVRILETLRGLATDDAGVNGPEVARRTKLPLSIVEGILNTLRKRGKVTCDAQHGGRPKTWWIPKKMMKAHVLMTRAQSAEQASLVAQWVRSSMSARKAAGVEMYLSYPYSRITSSTTTPTS